MMPGRKHGANRVNFRSASTGDRIPPSLSGSKPKISPAENHNPTVAHQNAMIPHADFRYEANRNNAGSTRYIWSSKGRLHRGPGFAFCRVTFWINSKFAAKLPAV